MEDFEADKLILMEEELNNLPLFFRKIYYNSMTDESVEKHLVKYNTKFQSDTLRDYDASRQICKILKIEKNDK